MKHVLFILLSILLPGCGQGADKPEVKTGQMANNSRRLVVKNIANEEIELLAIKYNLIVTDLVELLSEYEQLTIGVHIVDRVYYSGEAHPKVTDTQKNKELLPISVAIERLEGKFGVPKKTIAAILLDKMLIEEVSKAAACRG